MANLKNLTISDTGFIQLPSGTTAQRPSATNGMVRYNTTTSRFENYVNGAWSSVIIGKIGDWAYKEGPVSYNAAFKVNWNRGEVDGDSLDATTYGYGIQVKETGYYYAYGYQRGALDIYCGLSLNGDRSALENRSDNLWGHDHVGASGGGGWSQSICVGLMEATWIISFGPYTSGIGSFSADGYNGGLLLMRLA